MRDRPASRRTLLRTGAALAGAGSLSALAGCQGILSERADETPSEEDDGTAEGPLGYVPEGSKFVATVDLDGLRTDDAVRSAVGELLRTMPETPESLPATLDLVQRSSGLDPRAASRLVAYGSVNRYGTVVQADWSTDDVVAAATGAAGSQRTYDGRPIYLPSAEGSGVVVAPLDDRWYALGGLGAVRDAIDVQRGEADPIGGTVHAQYEATRDGHIRLGATVPRAAQLFGTGENAALSTVTAVRGSITGGESSQLHVEAKTAAETESVATTVRTRIDDLGADVATNPQVDANRTLGAVVDATTVRTDGDAVVVSNDRGIDTLVYVGGSILFSFVLGLGNRPTTERPLASFSFGYDEDARVGTVSHDGGDAITASELFVRGDGFAAVAGADLTASGPWPAPDGRVEAGDQVTVGLEPDGSIRLVYEGDGVTAPLASFSGPDA